MSDTTQATTQPHPTPEFVEAPLKYLATAEDVPVYVASVGGGDTSVHEGNYALRPLAIHNGRARAGGFSLDREGFWSCSLAWRSTSIRACGWRPFAP